MSDEKDIQKMAKEFLDIWQKQLNSMIRDPESMAQMFGSLIKTQQDFLSRGKYADKSAESTISEPGNEQFSELQRGLHACEERIAALERKTEGKSRKSSNKSKKL